MVGGGIAGLAAAWELATGGEGDSEVVVYDPGHVGGKLLTTEFEGHPVDEGPDCFLTRVPYALDLCAQLGLDRELVAPQARQALVYMDGKLRAFPEGLVLGAPARLGPLARSGFLSGPGLARCLLDLVLPRARLDGDVGVWELVSARFGHEVADRLVEPLLGSIHAGTTRGMSAAASAPQILAAAQGQRSLMRGLHRLATGTAAGPPSSGPAGPAPPSDGAQSALFMAPASGMQAVVSAAVHRLGRLGTTFVPLEVAQVVPAGDGVVLAPDGERYDGVVVALPAARAARVLGPLPGGGAGGVLGTLAYASVALVTVALGTDALPVPAELSGVLVGPGNDLLMTACSFGSHKWPQWASEGTSVVRISAGKAGDERWAALADEALVERLCHDLSSVLAPARAGSSPLSPRAWRVSRWPASFPQYRVGHVSAVKDLKARLARDFPRLTLAGAAYEGAGVAACTASGRRAASTLRTATATLGATA